MTFEQFKIKVQTRFPIKFEETLIHSDDNKAIDLILNDAITKAISKEEIISQITVYGSPYVLKAQSVLSVVRSDSTEELNVFVLSGMRPRTQKITSRYDAVTNKLYYQPEDATVKVDYVKHTDDVVITDLTPIFQDWAVKYAVAILKEIEGYKGTAATLTALPFEFNYDAMKQEGLDTQRELEDKLDEISMGTLAIRSN